MKFLCIIHVISIYCLNKWQSLFSLSVEIWATVESQAIGAFNNYSDNGNGNGIDDNDNDNNNSNNNKLK